MVDEQYVISPVVQKHTLRRDNPVTNKISSQEGFDYVSILLCPVMESLRSMISTVNVRLQKSVIILVHGNFKLILPGLLRDLLKLNLKKTSPCYSLSKKWAEYKAQRLRLRHPRKTEPTRTRIPS